MGQDSLDQIKDMLFDHEVAINNDQLWKAINHKKSIGNRRFILGGIAVSALLISAISLWYMNSTNETLSNVVEKLNLISTDNNVVANQESTQVINEAELNYNSGINETKNTLDIQADINTNQTFAEAKKSTNEFNVETESKNSDFSTNNTTRESKSKSSKPVITQSISNRNLKSNTPAKHISEDIISESPTTNQAEITSSNNLQYLRLNEVQAISGLNMDPFSLNSNQKKLNLKLSNEVECYDYGGKKNSIYAVAYTSVDVNMQKLSTNTESQDYLESRESTESSLLSYHAGVQMKYLFGNGIYLKGGIEYGQVRERFAYRRTTQVTEILPGQIIQIDIQPNGDTTIVYGNAPVTTITMKNWRIGNNFKTLDFTALAGYQMNKGSLVYSAELGASYNTMFSFSGLILDETGEPFDAVNYFKDRINWGILGAVNIGYKLTPKTTVFTGMNFKSMLSPINTAVNVINQKYTRIGIHLGVEIKLR